MPKSLFASLLKNVPASASVAIDGTSSSEFGKYVDTGSYVLNAALSGSLFGGMPDNKITVFAGESSTGKTFFILSILKAWMRQNPTGNVIYFDTESAVTNQMLTERGLDLSRIAKVEPETIEQFRQSALAILDNYEAEKTDTPIIMVLDSLGNLSSLKEVTDIRDQKDSRDMTKAQLIRGTFRVLRLRLAKLAVPMLVTNHVYQVVGCLTDSASVIMADGTVKNITDIAVGDMVNTLDGPHPVTDLYQYEVNDTYDIEFEDGTIIQATPNHKFMTTDGRWIRSDELSVTDEIRVGVMDEVPA
jgi:RecA/RadA recombinase